MRALRVLVLAVCLMACASAVTTAHRTLNAAAALGTAAASAIAVADERAQIAAVDAAATEREAVESVAEIRARFRPVWAAYARFRAAWAASSAALAAARSAEALGQEPDLANFIRTTTELAAAQAALEQAIASMR